MGDLKIVSVFCVRGFCGDCLSQEFNFYIAKTQKKALQWLDLNFKLKEIKLFELSQTRWAVNSFDKAENRAKLTKDYDVRELYIIKTLAVQRGDKYALISDFAPKYAIKKIKD